MTHVKVALDIVIAISKEWHVPEGLYYMDKEDVIEEVQSFLRSFDRLNDLVDAVDKAFDKLLEFEGR